jgi:heptosyltransferase III
VPAATGKILVIRGGAIGDFILTLPVLTVLRERFPKVRIELLCYARVSQLAVAGGLVDHAESIDARPMASFFAKNGPLPSALADYFASFALIISYLFDPDRIFQDNVARCSKAQFLVGPHRPEEDGELHATDAFLRPLVRLAIFDADPVPRLKLAQAIDGKPDLILDPSLAADREGGDPLQADHWLALHPGSGSELKNWPEERWSALLRHLSAGTKLRFLLLGGEAEGDRLNRLASVVSARRSRIASSLPLPDVGLLLGQCQGYVGHDSGISHLAAAVGLRGLVLWGQTRQQVWRPRSERIRLLASSACLAELAVEDVVVAIRHLLADQEPPTRGAQS